MGKDVGWWLTVGDPLEGSDGAGDPQCQSVHHFAEHSVAWWALYSEVSNARP